MARFCRGCGGSSCICGVGAWKDVCDNCGGVVPSENPQQRQHDKRWGLNEGERICRCAPATDERRLPEVENG